MRYVLAMLLLLATACSDSGGGSVTDPTDPSTPSNPSNPGTPTAPAVGSEASFNVDVDFGCTNPKPVKARVVAVSAHAVIYEDERNPTGGFTAQQYQAIADTFGSRILPTDTTNFGSPTDLDRNGRVIILYTRAVNELTPAGADYIVGGFFYARDLLPQRDSLGIQGCQGSNQAEMFYMLAADPSGTINGHTRTADYVRESTLSTTAHEFQHLINASRRIYVNNASDLEETWLDEGLAHVAEELNFYANAPGTGPGLNVSQQTIFRSNAILGAFNEYGVDNLGRFAEYLKAPTKWSPYAADGNDSLAIRGAAWSFLRYAADRKGGDQRQIWYSLVNSRQRGLANVSAVFGVDPLAWMRDWTVANYTDDAVSGVAAQYTQPSWNFRDLFANRGLGGAYPLAVVPLAAGTPLNLTIKSGSAAYVRFGVLAGSQSDVRVSLPGATQPGSCSPVTLTVGQVYQSAAADASAVCVPGGSAGAEYVLIPFHGSSVAEAQLAVTVTGTNTVPVTGAPTPSLAPAFSLLPTRGAADVFGGVDGGWERTLRTRERREVAARLGRGGTRARFQSSAAAGSVLSFSLVRTR